MRGLFFLTLAAFAVSGSLASAAIEAEIRTWEVPFTARLDKSVMAYSCDGVVTDRLLIRLPAGVPYELSVRELQVDYRGFSAGKECSVEPLKVEGSGDLLFRGLHDVMVILRHGHSEYRMVIVGSC